MHTKDHQPMTYWRGEKHTNKASALDVSKGPPQVIPRSGVLDDPHEVSPWTT